MWSAVVGRVLSVSQQKAGFRSGFIGVMSCRRQREEARGDGGSAAKMEDDEDDTWSLGDESEGHGNGICDVYYVKIDASVGRNGGC